MEKAAGVRDLETVYEISRLLNTGLDRETLSILVSLCENGVNPEALAAVVRELRREAKAVVRACVASRPPLPPPRRCSAGCWLLLASYCHRHRGSCCLLSREPVCCSRVPRQRAGALRAPRDCCFGSGSLAGPAPFICSC